AGEAATPMPGYTHPQRAQPVTVGHHLLAWTEMLERDRARFAFAALQARPSPLGAGALAGSTLQLPSPPDPMRNSLDAVADRDVGGALGALAVLVCGLEFEHERLALAAADPVLLATDAAEALVGEGVPFRDAHEQVAAAVRDGTFEPPVAAPRLPDVAAAVGA